MKNLTLIRHAESHLQRPLEQDKERLLTPNGFHQVSTISKQLEKKKCWPDYLLCSPAKRAIQTAELLCKYLKISPVIEINSLLYLGDSSETLLQSLFLPDRFQQVFIIGHNPTISDLAHTLSPPTQSIMLPTAGVISLRFNGLRWDNIIEKQGKFLFFIEPPRE
ncbi:hypothetical protein BEV13_04840 [Rickettsiella grylli]|uniref:SixA phosphatase family protein n=1 Tax=Rickettsiella grylli TaxID=59196 RepID=UPI0008FD80FB|nr:histidine phosphatase family protein [Rickettsiella grylli]OIZ99881.1 hypothetical protein BEV13_04840 [Rickettsiella grylli]